MKIQAVISDVDQTLLDTYQFIHMGKPLEVIYHSFYPQINPADLAEAHRRFQENNLQLAVPFPNVLNTLQVLQNKGIKIAAVTTRSRRTSKKTLELTNLLPFVDELISMEDVPKGELKPHPKPILLALEKLQIPATHAITIGDTIHDIEAGKKAGTKTIGVIYGGHGKNILKSKPDYIIDNIEELLRIIDKHQ